MSIETLRKFASEHYGIFTTSQADEHITPSQLTTLRRNGEVVRRAPRVWAFEFVQRNWHQNVVVAMRSMPMDAALCQLSALKWHGIGNLNDVPITVAAPRGRHGFRRNFKVHYRDIAFRQRQVVNGISITTVERTLVDVAAIVTPQQLSELVDEVLFKRLSTPAAVEHLLDRIPKNTAGTGRLREELARRNETDRRLRSYFEREVLTELRLAGFPEPIGEYKIIYNTETYFPDFSWPDSRVIVEIDGPHHDNPKQLRKDRLRRNRLESLGWKVMNFGEETDLAEFIQQLTKVLAQQAS